MWQTGDIRIGISGWRFKGWRGAFYPEKLPQRSDLEYPAPHFRSVELSGLGLALRWQTWHGSTIRALKAASRWSAAGLSRRARRHLTR